MKRVVLMMFLAVSVIILAGSPIILSSLSSLYYVRNPLDNLFKTNWLELEVFYRPLEYDLSYQNVSLTFRLPLNYFSAAVTASYGGVNLFEKIQNSEIDWSNAINNAGFFANVAFQLSAFMAAVTVPPFNVNFENSEVYLSDNRVKLALGIGNVKLAADYSSYVPKLVKKGGAALYYINNDLIYVDSDGISINSSPTWLNAKVGLLADAEGYDGRVVLDLGFDLLGVIAMQNTEDSSNEILNYIYGTLEIEGKPLIIGVTYGKSRFLLSGGLNLFEMLKGWVEVVFDQKFDMQGIGAFAQLYF
ncbi:MAG: hypothetical protein J7L34_04945 [Thermotogaceae bacterium]|nr:hypothetical protein [Thermotogaceae bacterium]